MAPSLRQFRRRAPRGAFAFAAALGLTLAGAAASAQDVSVTVDPFQPATSAGLSYLEVHDGDQIGQGAYEVSVLGAYADDPVIMNDDLTGDDVGPIIDNRIGMNVLAGVGITNWLSVGADFPVELYEQNARLGDADEFGEDESADLGDIRLVPEAQFFSSVNDPLDTGVEIGVAVPVRMPTSTEEDLNPDGVDVEPSLVFEGVFAPRASLALNTGYLYRSDDEVAGLEVSDAVTYGAGLDVAVVPRFSIIPEITGQIDLNDSAEQEIDDMPLTALMGFALRPTEVVRVRASAGAAWTESFDNPDLRTVVGVALTAPESRMRDHDDDGIYTRDDACPQVAEDIDGFQDLDGCPDEDNDADMVADAIDGCPDQAEDMDGFQDDDGCPDTDNDNDRIADADDQCPNRAEDADGYNDLDGCPDPDNDSDTVADANDQCPGEAEDMDGFQDEDGCPDIDNDMDGLLDVADACPSQAEDLDGRDDGDGCPEEGEGPILITCEAIEIEEQVEFETGSAEIRPTSYELLNTVADAMIQQEGIERVRIEGHTDDQGAADFNLELSQGRAESVMSYLISRGVSPERLRAVGFGEQEPVATNDTPWGRQKNRRVEFDIVEQSIPCITASL